MGPDGWCINFDKGTRTCSIYNGEHPLGHILQQFLLPTLSLYGFFFLWQIVRIFVVWSQRYSNHCLELRRRNLTKRRAGLFIISISYVKHYGNKLSILDKNHHEFASSYVLDAVFVEIRSKKFMAPNQRSWITSTIQ